MDPNRVVEAVRSGSIQAVSRLLKGRNRAVNRPDDDGVTPLMAAVETGSTEMVRLLLEAGADVNARDAEGNTALRTAAAAASPEVIKLLIDAGADPTIPGRLTLTPLDRLRERQTPEGRTALAYVEKVLAARKAQKKAGTRRAARGGKPAGRKPRQAGRLSRSARGG